MMRWAGVAICLGGFLVLTVANAAQRPEHRNTTSQRVTSDDRTKHVRHASAQKLQKSALKRNLNASKQKVAKHKIARKAKAQRAKLTVFDAGKPISKGGGIHRLGVPYVINGQTYTPQSDPDYRAEGKASWYGSSFHGRRTANGEKFDMDAISAAHPTLPLPSYVRVTNLENHRSIVVRVNDRGPYRGRRLIDVSVRTAKLLGFYDQGLAQVRVEYLSRAELGGSIDAALAATLRTEVPSAIEVAAAAPVKRETSAPSSDTASSMLSSAALR